MDSFKTSLLTSKKLSVLIIRRKRKNVILSKRLNFSPQSIVKDLLAVQLESVMMARYRVKVNIHTDLLLQKAQGSTWHKALKALKDTTLLQVKSFSLTSLKNTHRYTKKWFCPKTTFHDWGETRKGQIYGIPHCFTWKFLLTRVAKRRAIPPSQDINGHIAKCQQKKCHATSDKDKRNRPSNKNVVWSTESK